MDPEVLRFQRYVLRPEELDRVEGAVTAASGLSIRGLCKATGMSTGKVRGCVRELARRGRVSTHRTASELLVFAGRTPSREQMAAERILREPTMQRLLTLVEAMPNCTQKELCELTKSWGWSASTTKHRLKRLLETGLIQRDEQGRRVGTTVFGRPIVRTFHTFKAA